MKKVLFILVASFLWLNSYGQFTIETNKTDSIEKKVPSDIEFITPPKKLDINYYSAALERAKRRMRMRQINRIESNIGIQLTQASFGNWSRGGDNTFSGKATFDFRHIHNRDKLTVDYRLTARYGINVIDKKTFKNEDEFKINTQVKWKISGNWSYSGTAALRSQFTKGYASRTDTTLKSNFMAPGVFDIGFGFNYKGKKSPLNITISPITGNVTFVLDKKLQSKGINGVEKGKSSKSLLGSSFDLNYEQSFYKNIFKIKSDLFAFYNYEIPANARWTTTFEVKATKFLVTSLYVDLIYDQKANAPNKIAVDRSEFYRFFQFNYVLGVGLTYRFSNQK